MMRGTGLTTTNLSVYLKADSSYILMCVQNTKAYAISDFNFSQMATPQLLKI